MTLPVLTGTVKIMEAGDSIAGGRGVTCGRRWAMRDWMNTSPGVHVEFVGSQVEAACGHPGADRHEGYGGATIADTAANIAARLAANPCEILILTVGVNDCKESGGYKTAAQMINAYAALLDAVRAAAPNTRILASEVIPPNGSLSAEFARASITAQKFNPLLSALVTSYGDGVRLGRNGRFILNREDGLHPDIVVYLLMAWYNMREIWSWLSDDPPAATDAGVLRFDPYAL